MARQIIYNKKTGERLSRMPVDAQEMLKCDNGMSFVDSHSKTDPARKKAGKQPWRPAHIDPEDLPKPLETETPPQPADEDGINLAEELSSYSASQLKDWAVELGVKGAKSMNKADLVATLVQEEFDIPDAEA